MSFRTVIIESHSKLEYSQNYLVFKTSELNKMILLDEITTLIIQSTEVSLTTSLLSELVKRKIKVIFCDEKRNPLSELSPFYNSHNSPIRIIEQINWDDKIKKEIWQLIVKDKIKNQCNSLYSKEKCKEANLLKTYINEVLPGDVTNREGHAAKVYFNAIYFDGFTRELEHEYNYYLNYGYTILLSQFNRSIVAAGYLTQIGIHHKNEFNQFNFSCDLMECFRFIIDDEITSIKKDGWKDQIINLLNKTILINGKEQTLSNAITIYCNSIFKALSTGDVGCIKFPSYVK